MTQINPLKNSQNGVGPTPSAPLLADVDSRNTPGAKINWLRRDHNGILLLCGVFYILLYLFFWPPIVTTMDESAYLNQGFAFRQGTVYNDVAKIDTVFSYSVGPHIISMYPPGMGLILAGASVAGWKFALGVNLLSHLATFWVLAAILRRLNVPAWFALLYLFHPTAVTYSRTVMADPPSSLLFAGAFLLYLRRKMGWCGMLLGLSTLIRNANIIAVPLMMLACVLDTGAGREVQGRDWTRRIMEAASIAVGAVPFYAIAYGYQASLQGGGWAKFSNQLSPHNFPKGIAAYLRFLLVLYPGMMVAPLLYRGKGRAALALLPYGFVLMYSCYQFQDATGSAAESFIIGQRYMLVVLPLWIAAYSEIAWRFCQKLGRPARLVVAAVAFGLLACATVGVHYKHQVYLKQSAAVRDALMEAVSPSDTLLCNVHVAKLLHPGWGGGRRYTQTGTFGDDKADLDAASQIIDAALQNPKPGGHVVVVDWSRDYRAETGREKTLMRNIAAKYTTQPLAGEARKGLPDTVEIFVVTGKK